MCIVRERRPAGFLDMKCQTCCSVPDLMHRALGGVIYIKCSAHTEIVYSRNPPFLKYEILTHMCTIHTECH